MQLFIGLDRLLKIGVEDGHPPLDRTMSVILKCKLSLWYRISQITFDDIKKQSFVTGHLCNISQEDIIRELILQRFEVVIRVKIELAAQVANPNLDDQNGVSLLFGWSFILTVRYHN